MKPGQPEATTPLARDSAAESPAPGPQPSTLNSQLPPTIPDHELLRRIGAGSYGEVWLARSALGTLRAIKIVHRAGFDHDQPYEREFKGIQKFEPVSRSHEGLVDILQVGRNDAAGCFYYVMELADDANVAAEVTRLASPSQVGKCESEKVSEGLLTPPGSHSLTFSPAHFQETKSEPPHVGCYEPRTLRADLKRHGRLPVAECVIIGLSLAEALAHLHRSGLIHRDIKPSNIIFVDGKPKLADIGLVADISEARSFVGTTGFIPPEGPGTAQADLYSLGKVLYEISTGHDRQDFPALPPNLRELPDANALIEFNEIVVKACANDPRRRYSTAEELQADLLHLQRGQSVILKHTRQRHLTLAAKATLVAVLLAALIAALPFDKLLHRGRAPSPEAVRLFELGRWYLNRYTDEARTKAIQCLNQAVQIEPRYADAYILLFELHVWDSESEDKWKINRELAAKLMAIDPKRAEAHTALSWARHGEGDWRGAEREIQTAIRLNPNYSTARGMYGYYLSLLGRVEEAVPQLQRAEELDPTSRLQATVAGFPFMAARQYDLAISQFRKALELDPNFAMTHHWIGSALEAKGEYLEALGEFEKNAVLSGVDETKARQRFDEIRHEYTSSGPRGYWLKVLESEMKAKASHNKPKLSEENRWPVAGVYAQLGEKEKALDLLEKMIDEGGYGYWLKLDPLYAPLRAEPRFRALLKRLGLEK